MSTVANDKEWKVVENYPSWEMSSEDGRIRSIENKKNYKKFVHDTLGRTVVVMYESDGYATCWYLDDLYALVYGAKMNQMPVVPSEKVLEAFPNYESQKKREAEKIAGVTKKRKSIRCVDTGEVFSSYTECAKHFGFVYDKFYYQVKYNHKPFEGHTFEEVDA